MQSYFTNDKLLCHYTHTLRNASHVSFAEDVGGFLINVQTKAADVI